MGGISANKITRKKTGNTQINVPYPAQTVVTGLGFKPSKVTMFCSHTESTNFNGSLVSVDSGQGNLVNISQWKNFDNTASAGSLMNVTTTALNAFQIGILNFNSDGFTFDISNVLGSTAGKYLNIFWMAEE